MLVALTKKHNFFMVRLKKYRPFFIFLLFVTKWKYLTLQDKRFTQVIIVTYKNNFMNALHEFLLTLAEASILLWLIIIQNFSYFFIVCGGRSRSSLFQFCLPILRDYCFFFPSSFIFSSFHFITSSPVILIPNTM